MMTSAEQRQAAKKFAEQWNGRGYEKGESQLFWIELLTKVYGVKEISSFITFEDQVKLDHTSFIDGYIDSTHVMIEQKSIDKSLTAPIKQSDGSSLTPFAQAKRYSSELPYSKRPRWIITCNFQTFYVYDMEKPSGEPAIIELKNLEKEYYRLQFIVDTGNEHLQKEKEVSLQAGTIVGWIYNALYKQYINPTEESLKSLNALCVRLVFCFYAEDAGIFGRKSMFSDYMSQFSARDWRTRLMELFQVLDTEIEKRSKYIEDDLNEFPYVNGGLFSNEDIEIPPFTDEIVELLLNKASKSFDWSEISPTIFGAVFESTLNPKTRRSGGMYYTSVADIHKVIDALFLDNLKNELRSIKELATVKLKREKLDVFQQKLASLKWLDPACGSGNFLTESYISIRRLENEVIMLKVQLEKGQVAGQMLFGDEDGTINPIKVSISQFYGIEINDFAVTVARTALWIAESQMLKETEDIIHMNLDFLPLKTNAFIVEGNALELDWETVIPKYKLNYIMGNPPFSGGMQMDDKQKYEIRVLLEEVSGAGELDYVCGWYKKSMDYIMGTSIQVAFVSTNSICQGSHVITFWKYLVERYNIRINFAYTTFVWNNDANDPAKVHCIIVGFSTMLGERKVKRLYSSDKVYKECNKINAYLADNDMFFVESRSNPICDVPHMRFGSMPRDDGGFVVSAEERKDLILKEPLTKKWIKPYIGADEFLRNKERYCLWLVDADPAEILQCPTVVKRIEHVRNARANSKAEGTRKFALTPTLFCQIAQPDSDYIIVPKTSGGNRNYIPLGFMDKDSIASDLVFLIPDAGLYEFGVLMSNVHNSWMRLVAGRLKSDYRYSKDIVYNNFPWPTPTEEQKNRIIETAQEILDARNSYLNCKLVDMYSKMHLFPKLLTAHQHNDKAVMQAYGFWKKLNTESECVSELMKMYKKMTE